MSTRTETTTGNQPPTNWTELARIEPRLIALEQEVRHEAHYADDHWRSYERMKRRLSRLAGWDARRPELGTSNAYDTAHAYLVSIMEGVAP